MLKIIIQSTPKCADLLRYLSKDINAINKAGFEVKIEIANQDRIDMLATNNINRLPVMIAPDKSLVVGINEIMELIEKNVSSGPQQGGSHKQSNRTSQRPKKSVDDYLQDAIYEGVERSERGLVAKQEQEYEDDHFDYDKEKKKASKQSMKHRSPFGAEEEDDEPTQPKRKTVKDERRPLPKRRAKQEEYDSEEDNVGGYDKEPLDHYADGMGDVDSQMMHALLSNL